MAKDEAALKAQGEEIEAILQEGKKKELNFVLMKSKGGVVLKAGPAVKGFPKLRAECKADGGMPAFSACGMLTVSGRTMNMTQVEEEPVEPAVMRKLAGQAKKHFKAMGIRPAKMIMTLPNGEVIDSDSETGDEDEGSETETESLPETGDQVLVGDETGDDGSEKLKTELTERLKALVPQVKEALGRAVQGADKLAAALKAAGGEIAGGALEKAARLLDAIEKGLKDAPKTGGQPTGDQTGLRDQLVSEFKTLSGDLRKLVEQGEKAVAGKAQQFAQMFRTELDGDLKKAGSILAALKRFVENEASRLVPPEHSPVGDGDGKGTDKGPLGKVVDKVGEVVEKVVDKVTETVGEVRETLTSSPEELKQRAGLEALGLSVEQRNELMEKLKTDPKAIEKLKTERMTAAGVPVDQQAALLKMSDDNPKAFAAALASLGSMQKDGAVDISPAATQKSLEDLETARKETAAKQKLADEAARKLGEANTAYGTASKAATDARGKADLAARAIEDLKNRIGDPAKLTPEQRKQLGEESRKLINENELAKAALAKAIEAEKQASMDYADASDKNGKAQDVLDKAKGAQDKQQAAVDAKDGKKALLEAMTFGPLSGSGKMSDEDKAKFADAFGKNAKVAGGMLSMTGSAKNPAALAANVGMLADTASGGFAAPDGGRLDLPQDQLNAMALNAARMGDEAGGDYFKNFGAYLKSGKQLDPDPTGGMDGPLDDPAEETKRKNRVSLARSQAMSGAAVKNDGTVDFNSDAARAQMDQMMFHPGSLKTFTPQMNMKMAETKALFEDPATKDRANQTIKDTKLPGPTAPGRNAAMTLVAGTTGKPKGGLTDNDARASVLGAMMTPLSQGPVGSCFSTAPVRGIRETDPMRAMDEYSKIARTGQYTAQSGDVYPANTHLPEGENPLMRSFEYSVATAAADITNSVEKERLDYGLFSSAGDPDNLMGIKGIVGDSAWDDTWDASAGDWDPGVGNKLDRALKTQLTFEYNAGPQVGGPMGGGGDGHSTDGAYEIMYKGKALTTQAKFIEAIKEIALAAAGETAGTVTGDAIIDHVTKQEFVDSILASNTKGDYSPWKLESGGFENQTQQVLHGGTPTINDFLAKTPAPPPPVTEGTRTKAVLGAIMGANGGMTGKMGLVSTRGENANHAFNALPDHPSQGIIAPPDTDTKIQTELVDKGTAIATKKLPVGQAVSMFEEQIRAQIEGKPDAERDLLLKALKNRPTTEMTPREIEAKVLTEMRTYRDASATRQANDWIKTEDDRRKKDGETALTNTQKGNVLAWFKNNIEDGIKDSMLNRMMNDLAPPQVVVADSNWGGPEEQTYFVAMPDPRTGELKMWKKDMPGGKMTALGKNWADSKWAAIP